MSAKAENTRAFGRITHLHIIYYILILTTYAIRGIPER